MHKNLAAQASNTTRMNACKGHTFQVFDIGHKTHIAVISPDTAFWTVVRKTKLGSFLSDPKLIDAFEAKSAEFNKEMTTLRSGLKPTTVYFNPTDRCNLNCSYCYIPEAMRKDGAHMSKESMFKALDKIKLYFDSIGMDGRKPAIIYHGAEPMMNKEAVFPAMEKYKDVFTFAVQTNATLLDEESAAFLKAHCDGIGISLDGATLETADKTRRDWSGKGQYDKVVKTIGMLKDHPGFNVICTATTENMDKLTEMVDFLHAAEVKVCMLNALRCTQERSRKLKPDELTFAKHYTKALDRTYELYKKTGRKLVVANFANILLAILAPTARNLMCDISPCGGGRCFFAVAASGDLFPCSEFVGVPRFKGGNLFADEIKDVMASEPFKAVTGRRVEDITPCATCSVRHFCGSPCPAEAHEMNGSLKKPGAFCEFHGEQAAYAFRLIADGKQDAFLLDNWSKGIKNVFDADRDLLS